MKTFSQTGILIFLLHLGSGISLAEEPSALGSVVELEKSLVDAIAKTEKSVVSIARIHLESTNNSEAKLNPFGINLSELDSQRSNQDPNSPDFYKVVSVVEKHI